MKPIHAGIISLLFDRNAEGICTGRLVRAMLDEGFRISLLTSGRKEGQFQHPQLKKIVRVHRPNHPRSFFKWLAHRQNNIPNNYYLWTQMVSKLELGGDIPDVFYARSWPFASLVPAFALSKKYKRPLILHFSDPFPPVADPFESDPEFFKNLQLIADHAQALTFTNQETAAYQSRYINIDASKAFTLNHVAPESHDYSHRGRAGHFYYIGSLSPTRAPDCLLDGFRIHLKSFPDSRLFFVGVRNGKQKKYLIQTIASRDLQSQTQVLAYNKYIWGMFKNAEALISIDAEVSPAVFTTTKIVEYLSTNRPVLAVTPKDSPVAKLMTRCRDGVYIVDDYRGQSVADQLNRIRTAEWHADQFGQRKIVMHEFSGKTVATELKRIMQLTCGIQV